MPRNTKKQSQVKLASVKNASQVKLGSKNTVLSWLEARIGQLLIGIGVVGTFASLALAIEEIQHLKHPAAKLGCDLNPIVGCGANMDVWQGHVLFGMPNEYLGLITFVALLTIGFAIVAGAHFKRWFWQGLEVGVLFGVLFVHWFIYESIYVIGHLCPYCMLTWVTTITSFWYVTLYNLRAGHITLPKRYARASAFAQRHHADILAVWLLIIAALILSHFWYYWKTVL